MGGGAWWAVVHGVAQSWTRLQQLSSEYLQYGNTILSFCILSSDLAVSTYGNTVLSFCIFKHLILIFEMEIVTIPIYRQRIKAQRVHVSCSRSYETELGF